MPKPSISAILSNLNFRVLVRTGYMRSEPNNLILLYLRRIDKKIDRLALAMVDIGRRVTSLEAKVALIHGDFAAQSERIDRIELRLERIELRLERIERRLDIVNA